PDGAWALVDTTGAQFLQGWVSTDFIRQSEDFEFFEATSVPAATDQVPTGLVLRADENVNIRSAPVIFSPRVGLLPVGTQAEIIGRKSTYDWWKIQTADGTIGWVSAVHVFIVTADAYQLAPVVTD
ncbi:MAG: SH3 domain-containing protein, partial [Chloroflexota bacterium]